MAVLKSLVFLSSQAAVVFLLLAVAAFQTQMAKAQSCTDDLTKLSVCAPFVVPGATEINPGSDCCGALQSVQHDCICSTFRIASQLPSQCNLPPLNCGN